MYSDSTYMLLFSSIIFCIVLRAHFDLAEMSCFIYSQMSQTILMEYYLCHPCNHLSPTRSKVPYTGFTSRKSFSAYYTLVYL